jgi:hypothetical protein
MAAPMKSSFRELESILNDKNYKVVSTKTFRMPNNYLIGDKYKLTSEKKANALIKKSNVNAITMIRNFMVGKYKKQMLGKFYSGLFKSMAYKNIDDYKEKTTKFSTDKRG